MIPLTNVKENNEKEAILEAINLLRKDLIHIGLKEGLNSEETIILSQKLDVYITKYLRLDSPMIP